MDSIPQTPTAAWIAKARQVAAADPGILGLYLFGSQASGSAREHSDIDLGALFDAPRYLDTLLLLDNRFEEALGRKVDLVDTGSCDAFLALDIVRGERIFCRDEYRCDVFDLYVMRRAADLEHFERERRRVLLTARASARRAASGDRSLSARPWLEKRAAG